MLGLPPVWYKSAPYRSRAVKDPRGVLADFGVELPAETEIRVWDSTAETRFLVVPMRPAGTEGWSEERLAALVTRDSMIGTGLAEAARRGGAMDGVHDMGGMDGFGKVEPEPNEPALPRGLGRPRDGDEPRHGRARAPGTSTWRASRASACRRDVYLSSSYYERWELGMEQQLVDRGLVDADELAAGHAARPARNAGRARFTSTDVDRVLTRGSFDRPADGAGTLCAGRARAREEHPSRDAHAAAALRARSRRHRRARAGLPRVSGRHRRSGGDDAQWLYTVVLRGPRAVGRGSRSDASRSRSRRSSPISSRLSDDRSRERARQRAASVAGMPRDDDGPVFREPWEAQAFAMALALHERGLFTWSEWAATLGEEIRRAQAAGDPDTGETYYRHWLARARAHRRREGGRQTADMLARYRDAWDHAADRTPHGKPIELRPEDFPAAAERLSPSRPHVPPMSCLSSARNAGAMSSRASA